MSFDQNILKLNPFKFQRQKWRYPQFQSHRGYWSKGLQENTLDSMEEALRLGYEMAECDVRLSRDLIPVVIHDNDLQRLKGLAQWVGQLTATELKTLADIPTLEELLLSKNRPVYLNIEIKGDHLIDPRLEILVAHIVEKTKSFDSVIFSTFNPITLAKLKKLLPQVPCGWLINAEKTAGNWIFLRRMWLSPLLPFDFLHLNDSMIDLELMLLLKSLSIGVAAWTVNDRSRANQLLGWGVQSIITDRLLP